MKTGARATKLATGAASLATAAVIFFRHFTKQIPTRSGDGTWSRTFGYWGSIPATVTTTSVGALTRQSTTTLYDSRSAYGFYGRTATGAISRTAGAVTAVTDAGPGTRRGYGWEGGIGAYRRASDQNPPPSSLGEGG